jgi:hypothetical protein
MDSYSGETPHIACDFQIAEENYYNYYGCQKEITAGNFLKL